jgi:transcriptional regulator with XRE-family HTH domain
MMAGMPAPTRDPEPLWLFLNRWLKEHGWAQVRLADAVGVHETVVGRWLHADARRRARPSRQTLPRLAEVLGVPVQDLMVMTIADQTRNPAAEAAGRARLKTQLQAVEEQYERWIAAVGIENEGYFWRHLKSQGDSTVDLIRGLGTAVSDRPDTAVNPAVNAANSLDDGPDDDAKGGLRARQREDRALLAPRRGNANVPVAA